MDDEGEIEVKDETRVKRKRPRSTSADIQSPCWLSLDANNPIARCTTSTYNGLSLHTRARARVQSALLAILHFRRNESTYDRFSKIRMIHDLTARYKAEGKAREDKDVVMLARGSSLRVESMHLARAGLVLALAQYFGLYVLVVDRLQRS